MINVDKIFVAHYKPLLERKQKLILDLEKLNINAEWIEEEPNEKETLITYTPHLWNKKFEEMKIGNYPPQRLLKKSEISLLYKHIQIYNKIINENIKTCLVLEDDVIFDNNFINNFNLNLSKTPKDWDFIFIGNGCNLSIPEEQRIIGTVAYKKEHPASKCTDSYIIKKKSAEKILNTINTFTFPIDFELNYQMFKHGMNVYWWEPSIVKQGSQSGLYQSEIQ